MLFKRARELVSDVYYGLVQGTVRDAAKCNKIIKAIDNNNIDELRTTLAQLNRDAVEEYLRRPIDSMRRTPLHYAAWAENTDILDVLLGYVSESDVEDKTGATPMMFVVGSGSDCLKKMNLLINKRADINRKDKSGWTLLHAAVQSKKRDILELLVNNGANLHIVDGEHRTLLHIACDNADQSIVKYLVGKGVSLKSKDKNGWTPLHVACGPGGDCELVRYLIQFGADPFARDMNHSTALDLAVQFQMHDIERYLRTVTNMDTDTDLDDMYSDGGLTNDTYESDNVFESEPASKRVSQRSNMSFRMVERSSNKQHVVKV